MVFSILQYLILGIIQGVTEWIPISSSGMTSLVMSNFFGITNLAQILQISLFLHLGTFFAALIYFRKDVANLFVSLFKYKKSSKENQSILKFLIIATIITGVIGIFLMKLLSSMDLELTGKTITLIVGLLLLITSIVQLSSKIKGFRKSEDIKLKDSAALGIVQGVSILPGISRSGITVSALLLRKFDDTTALRLSFLLSLPIVLLGNLFLNIGDIASTFQTWSIIGLLASFVLGLATIHVLMKLAKKINFGWFAFIIAVLMMTSILI